MKRETKIHTHLCEDCGKPVIPYEAGYKKCKACFFKSKKCEDCGKQIIPYVEGYTKCRSCHYKNNERLRNYSKQYLDEANHRELQRVHESIQNNSHSISFDWEDLLFKIIIGIFVFGFISPILLGVLSPENMQYVIGNPKPLYLYDIDSSCSNYETNIISSLNELSAQTDVKFIRLSYPLALITGGMSYTCGGMMSNPGAAGESEAGFVGVSFFIVAWNKIRLTYSSEDVILHETLHSLGFGHSSNPQSIMYAYSTGQGVEKELSDFMKKWYAHNPIAYLNIFPLNLMWILLFVALFLFPH